MSARELGGLFDMGEGGGRGSGQGARGGGWGWLLVQIRRHVWCQQASCIADAAVDASLQHRRCCVRPYCQADATMAAAQPFQPHWRSMPPL